MKTILLMVLSAAIGAGLFAYLAPQVVRPTAQMASPATAPADAAATVAVGQVDQSVERPAATSVLSPDDTESSGALLAPSAIETPHQPPHTSSPAVNEAAAAPATDAQETTSGGVDYEQLDLRVRELTASLERFNRNLVQVTGDRATRIPPVASSPH